MSDQPDPGFRAILKADNPYPTGTFTGRGIVICAGGVRLLTNAWVTISILRHQLGCTLPIELWHLGPAECGPVEAALFHELDVTVVDAFEVRREHPVRTLGGWELKPYAIRHSRFAEVLLLDADNLCLRDPAFLFDCPPYRQHGSVFWPDIERLSKHNKVWARCGVTPSGGPAFESGQLVIDKSRCWRALLAAGYLNEHSDTYYELIHGDKDTYQLGWLAADQTWAMPAHRARTSSFGLFQHDFDGEVLFQHRSGAKWVLNGINRRFDAFALEAECLAAIEVLAQRWSGTISGAPSRTSGDLEREAELVARRWFSLDLADIGAHSIELLTGNRVGEGRTPDAQRWYVVAGELRLEGRRGVLCSLTPSPGRDVWRGQTVPVPQTGAT